MQKLSEAEMQNWISLDYSILTTSSIFSASVLICHRTSGRPSDGGHPLCHSSYHGDDVRACGDVGGGDTGSDTIYLEDWKKSYDDGVKLGSHRLPSTYRS